MKEDIVVKTVLNVHIMNKYYVTLSQGIGQLTIALDIQEKIINNIRYMDTFSLVTIMMIVCLLFPMITSHH